MQCRDLHEMLAMKVNNTLGRREGKKEHLVKEYHKPKFNSALVAQGASMLQAFEACMRKCVSVLKFTFTVVYKVLGNNHTLSLNYCPALQKCMKAIKLKMITWIPNPIK